MGSEHLTSECCCHHESPEASAKPPKPAKPSPFTVGAVYSCPMHPEVRQAKPGSCPACGMALEAIGSGAEEDHSEQRRMAVRAVIAVVLSLPFLAAMVAGFHLLPLVSFALALIVVGGAGWPILRLGWDSVVARSPNMFTLIGLGIAAAFGWSTLVAFAPNWAGSAGGSTEYFEAAAWIMSLVLVGQWLEIRARKGAGRAIRGILGLLPRRALRVEDGGDREIDLAELAAGDRIRVRPGESVPADGVVLEGRGVLDEALVTGESRARAREVGEAVVAGTINVSGAFVMRASATGEATLVAKIAGAVAEVQASKAEIQRIADRVSAYFVPAVVLAAGIAFAAWLELGPDPSLPRAIWSSVAVLIIACPCALGLAAPMSVVVAAGIGARKGILVRDAAALERLARVDTLVFDKTGTLTEGKPKVLRTSAAEPEAERRLLALAGALERGSEHPLARAVLDRAAGMPFPPMERFSVEVGSGVEGWIDGERVRLGRADWASAGLERTRENGVARNGSATSPAAWIAEEARGRTVVHLSVGGRPEGWLSIGDSLKADASEMVEVLRREGVEPRMATGDSRATALAVASACGITEVEAQISPLGKADLVKRLRREGRRVAMAGDGVNDAPAIAEADVGIAMGTGTDIARETSGLVLLGGDLRGIIRARWLAKKTLSNIRQNLFFAFFYNAVGIPVAAGALYPWLGWQLSPAIAAAAMSLSSVSVIGNALRLGWIARRGMP